LPLSILTRRNGFGSIFCSCCTMHVCVFFVVLLLVGGLVLAAEDNAKIKAENEKLTQLANEKIDAMRKDFELQRKIALENLEQTFAETIKQDEEEIDKIMKAREEALQKLEKFEEKFEKFREQNPPLLLPEPAQIPQIEPPILHHNSPEITSAPWGALDLLNTLFFLILLGSSGLFVWSFKLSERNNPGPNGPDYLNTLKAEAKAVWAYTLSRLQPASAQVKNFIAGNKKPPPHRPSAATPSTRPATAKASATPSTRIGAKPAATRAPVAPKAATPSVQKTATPSIPKTVTPSVRKMATPSVPKTATPSAPKMASVTVQQTKVVAVTQVPKSSDSAASSSSALNTSISADDSFIQEYE